MGTPKLPSIHDLNILDKHAFVESIHVLFEAAPPLADKLYDARPYHSYIHLIDYANECIQGMNRNDLIQVINAHPRIGAAKETLSALLYMEQGYTAQQQQQQHIQDRLKELNDAYEEKYGFKFVVFVNGRSRLEIIPVFEQRLNHSSVGQELGTGLKDMLDIARDRLKKLTQIE